MGGGNVSRYYFTTWCEQRQEQELADELSESLEWHTGAMKRPSRSAWAMALDKQRLLAENDFGKLLNLVVADGQTLHIVFLLTYGSESARVLLDITKTMRSG